MTTDRSIRSTTHEESSFDPHDYIDINFRNFNLKDPRNTQHQMRVFLIKALFNIYKKGEVVGEALLDVGCGPVCFTPAIAYSYVNEVVLYDISETNLDVLRKWKTGENDHQKKTIMEFIVETTGSSYHLKRGGYIVVGDSFEQASYPVGDKTFRVASLSSTTIKAIFSDNGFEIKDWTEAHFTDKSTHLKCFCMLARKT